MSLLEPAGVPTFEPRVESASAIPSVLQIGLESPWVRSGGLNRYFAELVGALRAMGMPVTAVVTGDKAGEVGDQPWFRVVASESSSIPTRLFAIRREIYSFTRQVDLVDAHFALSGFAALAGPLRGRPLVVHFQGPWADESAANGESALACTVKRWVERRVYRRASGFVVLSQSFRRVLLERYGAVPWDVAVMAPGVDTDRFRPGNKAEARAALGVPPGVWVALAVRRLVPRMGLDVLLDVWRIVVAAADVPVLLLVAGDGPSRTALEAQAERLGLTDFVRFIGRVDDASLVSAYRAADVSVVPSVALEGYGLVVLESLATGTPVVASAVGGLTEAVGSFDEGSLVPPGDPDALAERLIGAMHNVRPLPLASACRRYAEGFSWAEVARRHADLYRRMLQKEVSLTEKEVSLTETEEAGQGRRLRVVVVGHTAQLSGGELAISRVIATITNEVDVHVVLAEHGPLVDVLESAGATVEILQMPERARALRRARTRVSGLPLRSMLATAIYTVKLARRLRRLRPDLIHTNTLKAALYGGVAARAAGVPCLWHVRDRIAEDYLPRSAVTLVRLAARLLPTEIVANSRTTLETLHLGHSRGIRVVSDGVATVVPSPIEPMDHDWEKFHAPRNQFRAVMVGRLSPWKGQDIFLRAFAEAFGEGSEEAVIVGSAMFGEDEYEQALVELAVDLGIAGRVEFRGFRTDIWTEFDQVDAAIHASVIPEPFGQVVVEGMAAGLAVVAVDAGGPAEIITHEVDGLLYPPGDVAALAAILRRLADNPTLRSQLGEQAARTADKYRSTSVAAQLVEIYQRIARSKSGNGTDPV
jgi:glycosyltransferase involved in cell wall biosynthesis